MNAQMTKKEALAYANKHYGEYNIYTRDNEVVVRDQKTSELITKISFCTVTQPELF